MWITSHYYDIASPALQSQFSGELRSVCTDLGPGETLITWPILNGFPDFKDQQTHDALDIFWYYS